MKKYVPVTELSPEELEARRRKGREWSAKRRVTHPGEQKANRKKWYNKNKKRAMELNAVWEKRNPEAAKSMRILARIRAGAKKRGLEVTITAKWILSRLERCEITGIPFHTGPGRKATSLSVDRIDSGKGYSPDNCQVICLALNTAFGDWGREEFTEIWRKV